MSLLQFGHDLFVAHVEENAAHDEQTCSAEQERCDAETLLFEEVLHSVHGFQHDGLFESLWDDFAGVGVDELVDWLGIAA